MQMTLATARLLPAARASDTGTALVIAADRGEAIETAVLLESVGCEAAIAHCPEEAIALCRRLSPMFALIDVGLATAKRMDVIARLTHLRPEMICVLVAAEREIETAIGALAAGAYDYLRKPFRLAELHALITRCDELHRLRAAQATESTRERESERRLHGLTDGLPLAVFEVDVEQRLRFVNTALADWLSRPLETLIGRKAEEALGDLYPVLKPCIERAREGRRECLEAAHRVAGEERVLRVSCRPNRDDDDRVVGVFGQVEDTTELKRVEETVRTRDAWLRAILANSPTEIAIKDLDGRVLAVSRNTLQDHGLTEEEVIGRISEELLPPELIDSYVAADRQVIATGEVLQQEITELRNGRPTHFLSAKFPLTDDGGSIIGVCSLTSDITPYKEVQARLHQAQKMEAVGQLTGGVAHDFNNLLAVILGNLELAEEELEASDPCSELVQRALDAGRRGASLIQRLLAFSRQQLLRPRSLDINEIVDSMTGLLSHTLGREIDLHFDAQRDLWRCRADPAQIESALLNLAINARDAMPAGGRLTLSTANVTLESACLASGGDVDAGEYATLSVGDTGSGISPEMIDRVFEPFFTTKGLKERSGLGLSMVFGFAKQSGGHVTIESEVDAGTRVTLYLPRCPQALER